jgi:hypothetical protein
MLKTIFNSLKSKQDVEKYLMHYIILTCFPKMWARIDHRRSVFYSKVLGSIQPEGSGFIISEAPETSKNEGFTQHHPVAFALFDDAATRKETNVDDLDFLSVLVGHKDFPEEKFPQLYETYTKMGQQKELCLYNKKTCGEFCLAVDLVLKGFRNSLGHLQAFRLALVEGRPAKKLSSQEYLEVNQYGFMLHMLSRGAALRMYLQNVNPLLREFCQPAPKRIYRFKEKSTNPSTNPFDKEVESEELQAEREELEAEGEELEAELEADNKDFEFLAEPEDGSHAWQICLRWIKLLVSYFSATSMLIDHLHVKEFPEITVRLLRNSPGEKTLMPWEALLRNPKYFLPRDRSNNEIISILQQAISSKPYNLGI